METRSSSRRRTLMGLMPLLGLAAMSCTINPDATPNQPEIATDQSDGATTDGGGVRSSDGTSPDTDGTATQATGGGQASGGTQGETSGSGSGSQSDTGAGTQGSSQGSSDTTATTGTDTTSSSDTETECARVEANFTAVVPSIYVLVDRSGSMAWSLPGGGSSTDTVSRWNAVKTTLIEEADPAVPDSGGVVYRMQDKAKFALATYTSSESTCPIMHFSESGAADELPKLNNWSGVKARLDAAGPGGGTPSSEGIDWVWQKIKENNDPNRILVFASDGDPSYYEGTRCEGYSFSGNLGSFGRYARVVKVVEAMHAENIKTFVISVGDGASADRLDDVARAGVGVTDSMNPADAGYPSNPNKGASKSDDYFFAGTDAGKLQEAFESVIMGARPCKFELEGTLTSVGSSGEVKINGELKQLDDPNGWQINSMTEIELLGDSCEQIRSDPNVDLKVSFSCEVFQPG